MGAYVSQMFLELFPGRAKGFISIDSAPLQTYSDDPSYYAMLAGHGYRILTKAVKDERAYRIDCPTMLICGEKDQAGSTRRYNRNWHKKTGLPIKWISEAGHNSNVDQPETINRIIEEFCNSITQ